MATANRRLEQGLFNEPSTLNLQPTVGSAHKYPVTTEGRLLAMIVMFCGPGLFGGIIGAKEKTIVAEENKILARLEKLEEKIDCLKREDK